MYIRVSYSVFVQSRVKYSQEWNFEVALDKLLSCQQYGFLRSREDANCNKY